MCNLYSITRSQEAMRRLFAVAHDLTGNLPPMPSVFPDMPAPIVRADGAERRLKLLSWGMPGPPQSEAGKTTEMRRFDVLIRKCVAAAVRGDVRCAELLLDIRDHAKRYRVDETHVIRITGGLPD